MFKFKSMNTTKAMDKTWCYC